jgi:hypothetical protein
MQIKIQSKDFFIKYFLQPISKVSDSCCVVVGANSLSSTVCSPDNSVVLNNRIVTDAVTEKEITLNIADIKKLARALEAISEEEIVLTFDKNNIAYKNKTVSFKYHLLEDGVINVPKINLEKINSIKFDTTFDISEKALSEMIKASTFCVDSNKIYFQSSPETGVTAELTDKTRSNVDSFGVTINKEYEGADIKNLCLSMEVVRIISTNKVKQVHCSVNNSLGVVLFNYGNKVLQTKYIVSSLTK